MRVTVKGQVTIPQNIREKYGISPNSEVDFVEDERGVYLVKRKTAMRKNKQISGLRGAATVNMTTDEIMALTRDAQ